MWQGIPSSASISSDHKDNAFVFERLINVSKDISDTFSNLFLRLTFFIPSSIINRIIDLIHLLDPWLNLRILPPRIEQIFRCSNTDRYKFKQLSDQSMRRTSPNQTNSSRYNDENVDIQELLVRNVRRNLVTLVLQYAHNIARSLIIDTSLN